MDWVETSGWIGAALTLAAYSMRTMLPLRVVAIFANVFFITYSVNAAVYPALALHLALLPLNVTRLVQILRDLRRSRQTDGPGHVLDTLKPLMNPVTFAEGAYIFRKGDAPDRLYVIREGKVGLEGLGKTLGPGEMFGEMAFFTDAKARTDTAICLERCEILALDEAKMMKAYYQDPALGIYLLKLIATRVQDNAGTAIATPA